MYKISAKLIPPKLDDETRKKISESIKKYRSSDSLIAYLFALQKNEWLPTEDKKIHTALFKLQKEYPDLFGEFIFSRGDLYPFSKELEEILFRLQQSGVLGTINPGFEKYILPNKSKKVILESLSEKLSKEEKEKLEQMTNKFESLLMS